MYVHLYLQHPFEEIFDRLRKKVNRMSKNEISSFSLKITIQQLCRPKQIRAKI